MHTEDDSGPAGDVPVTAVEEIPVEHPAPAEAPSPNTQPVAANTVQAAAPAPSAKPANRRGCARYIAHWRAALVAGELKYLGQTDNVSMSGVAIITDVNLKAKLEIRVYLEVPVQLGKPPVIVEAMGIVVHCLLGKQGFKVGIAFTHFINASDKLLDKALASGHFKELFDPNFS